MDNDSIKHLEYFKVENFKGLESLELKQIKQFNLILGDNNVGKTSVLEALLFDETPYKHLRNLHFVFNYKSNIVGFSENYLNFFLNKGGFSFNYNFTNERNKTLSIKKIETNQINNEQLNLLISNSIVEATNLPKFYLEIKSGKNTQALTADFRVHRYKDENNYFPFVKSGLTYQKDLVDIFSRTVNSDIERKEEFIRYLQIMANEIHDIIIDVTEIPDNPILLVLFKNGEKLPLFMMGDGIIRLIRLILEIILCKNKRLMIDEIDNGMHFSRMKEVWRVLLKVATKNNTQLFITTHDAECLRAFKEVLETEELQNLQKDVASYTLKKTEHETKAVQFNFQEFENAIDYSLNIRG